MRNVGGMMLRRFKYQLVFITFFAILSLSANVLCAQTSISEFHNILREKMGMNDSDLATLQEGKTIVKILPVEDKSEMAVSGLVGLQVPSEVFLKSFRETMVAKSNPAILEIGRFSNEPTLEDLKGLTFETRDLEDLKKCVVGNCKLKLSANMIARLQKDVNWDAPNYAVQTTQILKLMLLEYVRDYLSRGDGALIEYADKEKSVKLVDEQRALKARSSYINDFLERDVISSKFVTKVESALVWSKIKFGLKPVFAINHISIYQNQNEIGPQVLIAAKQIYANHYFDSSLALTAFVNVPGENSTSSYLIYENRSRADGLEGPFGKIKRGIVQNKAMSGLMAILDQSKATLNARAVPQTEAPTQSDTTRTWKRLKFGGVHLIFWVLLITAFAGLLALSNYRWKSEPT
ncbi:MAG TPA: hypothetical protein VLB68_26800 [Pyrinomonadaceae bacterium]|nr:hypothetical protein [Pyrinomonadaceae bacterium]